jgi:hypothetical protein
MCRFGNAVVIQHHPNIVTSSDLGLAVSCQYDLSNMTVANELDLKVQDPEPGDGPGLTHEVVVDSPSVAMRITVSSPPIPNRIRQYQSNHFLFSGACHF